MVDRPVKRSKLPKRLLTTGANVIGAAAGATMEAFVPTGGFLAAAVASPLAQTLETIGEEVERRALAPKEYERIGAAYYLIASEIDRRLKDGEQPRGDNFWEETKTGEPIAEELLEGVLLAARDSHERSKIPLLAHLYSSFVFDSSVSPYAANHLISLSNQMTYMEFVALAVLADDMRRNELAAPFPYSSPSTPRPDNRYDPTPDSAALISIMFGLHAKGLIMGNRADPQWGSISALNPRRVQLSITGQAMIHLARLDLVRSEDRAIFYDHLKRHARDTMQDFQ